MFSEDYLRLRRSPNTASKPRPSRVVADEGAVIGPAHDGALSGAGEQCGGGEESEKDALHGYSC